MVKRCRSLNVSRDENETIRYNLFSKRLQSNEEKIIAGLRENQYFFAVDHCLMREF